MADFDYVIVGAGAGRGVTGLRVVDASVLPVQVAGNTQAPIMAVAWIAADLILQSSLRRCRSRH